jgi:uncharacterized protein
MSPRKAIIDARRLTIMFGSRDHVHHHSLATELLSRARRAHLAGATMVQGVQGQGRSGVVHRQHLFSEDLPLSIVIVDEGSKIAAFVEQIGDLVDEALVLVEPVAAYRA